MPSLILHAWTLARTDIQAGIQASLQPSVPGLWLALVTALCVGVAVFLLRQYATLLRHLRQLEDVTMHALGRDESDEDFVDALTQQVTPRVIARIHVATALHLDRTSERLGC